MDGKCWLCGEKNKYIEKLEKEIDSLNRHVYMQRQLLFEVCRKQTFMVTVDQGRVTIKEVREGDI